MRLIKQDEQVKTIHPTKIKFNCFIVSRLASDDGGDGNNNNDNSDDES